MEQLKAVFAQQPRPIEGEEMEEIRAKFSWGSIVPALYEKVLQELHLRRLGQGDEAERQALREAALQG